MKLNVLPASAGVRWVKQGLRTFFRQPLALSGLFFMFFAATWMIGLVPWVGPLLKFVLVPSGVLGMVLAAREADQGRFPMPGLMLAAFRHGPARARAMLMLGVWWAASIALMLGLCALVDGGELAHKYLAGAAITEADMQNQRLIGSLWLAAGLSMLLSILFWHSSALTFFAGLSPPKSLFFSLVASKRNFLAYTVYCLLWSAVWLLIFMVTVSVLLAVGGPSWALGGAGPLFMLLGAMMFTSIYFTFRDTFEMSEAELALNPEETTR